MATLVAPIATSPKPPAGLIQVNGRMLVRRFGLLHQRQLTCIHGHRIHPKGTLFEIALPCCYQIPVSPAEQRYNQIKCDAQLYIVNMRARLLWAMDVTREEVEIIARASMELPDIIDFFCAGFPAARLPHRN